MAVDEAKEQGRAARVIRDPRLLPYFLGAGDAAALCQVQPSTLAKWRAGGFLQQGAHYTRRSRGPRGRVVYLRDGLLALMEEREKSHRPASPPIRSAVNPACSPALAAALQREAHGR